MRHRKVAAFTAAGAMAFSAAVAVTPQAGGSPGGALAEAVNAARAASGCPALQTDPLVTRVAEMATQSTVDYHSFGTAVQPMLDPVPALNTIGHPSGNAMLLSGFGVSEADAIKGLILQYQGLAPGCEYEQYGVNSWRGDSFFVTSVVLAAP